MLRRVAAGGAVGATCVYAARLCALEKSESHSFETAVKQMLVWDVLKVLAWQARRRHDKECDDFAAVQRMVLAKQLEANASTAYGVAHGFSEMLRSDDVCVAFRKSHPITTYGDWAPWVHRIAKGESNVLLKEPETMLAATSGTSGQRALLPYTQVMASAFFKYGILVVFDTLRRTLPESFELQKTCKLAFAPSWTYAESGLRIGPNSSNPNDKAFRRLLLLYSTPSAG